MIKFVQKWIREIREGNEIVEEGTAEKWTKCEDGLPSSDRKVQVIVFAPRDYEDTGMKLCFAQFNPHVGWKMPNSGVVVAWRDLDQQYRDIVNDMNFIKSITNK